MFPAFTREFGANTREFPAFTREFGANTREFPAFTREFGANTREFPAFTREFGANEKAWCTEGIPTPCFYLFCYLRCILNSRKSSL
ncbi:UNVERIFIED_CONTAM: hypothetical protein FO527_05935 [Bacillus sp. ATCC 13368]